LVEKIIHCHAEKYADVVPDDVKFVAEVTVYEAEIENISNVKKENRSYKNSPD
jgi:hypothetical protein